MKVTDSLSRIRSEPSICCAFYIRVTEPRAGSPNGLREKDPRAGSPLTPNGVLGGWKQRPAFDTPDSPARPEYRKAITFGVGDQTNCIGNKESFPVMPRGRSHRATKELHDEA